MLSSSAVSEIDPIEFSGVDQFLQVIWWKVCIPISCNDAIVSIKDASWFGLLSVKFEDAQISVLRVFATEPKQSLRVVDDDISLVWVGFLQNLNIVPTMIILHKNLLKMTHC